MRHAGHIRSCNGGWRVQAKNCNRIIYGPSRAHKSDADADLKQSRTAKTREEYRDILRQLQKTAKRQRDERILRQCGHVRLSGGGWQVKASVGYRAIYGPYRAHKSEADADLKQARTAKTREEYRSILSQLKQATQFTASGDGGEDTPPRKRICSQRNPLSSAAAGIHNRSPKLDCERSQF